MWTVLILYAAMGLVLGVEHYNDLSNRPRSEAIIAGVIMGVLWFPYEFCGAAMRVWEQVS